MSKIGKNSINVPQNVYIEITNNNILIKGVLGSLTYTIPNSLTFKLEQQKLFICPKIKDKKIYSIWATYRSIINNAIIGVTKGYSIKLVLIGIGYKVTQEQNKLNLKLGHSNTLEYIVPKDLLIKCIGNNSIYIHGIDLQRVNLIAAQIRKLKEPEIYKGKGIRYATETIELKQGKKK